MEQPPDETGNAPEQQPAPDAPRLTTTDASMLVLGALLFLVSFLSWYRVRYNITLPGQPPLDIGFNGWRVGFLAWASVIVALGAAVFAGMRIGGSPLRIRASAGSVYLLAGVTVFLFVALRFLVKPGLPGLLPQVVRITRGFGLYVALLIGVGMLVAGVRAFQSERR